MSVIEHMAEMVGKLKANPGILDSVSGMNKTFQFDLEDGEKFYLRVENGDISVMDGVATSAAATILASPALILDLMSGKADAIKSFMSGKLKVKGDIFSAQKITDLMKRA
ncbi:MAG: SCP2 sterol-binding domain-containing protein [Thermoplasmataceae archaeon]